MRRQQDAPAAPGDVIRLDGVTKAYQAAVPPALADVSMSVATGEVAAIMGPSGSGKSTLLNLIAGLDRPTAGTVTVAGRRINNLSESALARFRARHVGIIFQFFNLLDDLTVEDNVLLPAQLAGASRRAARARAGELLERMGIERHRDDYPARLSGGQRQRVAIARALVNAPELLYRFTHAASYGEVRADVAEVSRALPAGAVTGAASWLAAQNEATGNGAIMEPFVVAFALIGLVMAVLIVGNVVSGAVVAGYQRIGVLKCIGLSPAQVVVAYLSRVGWPALAGCLAGVVAGNVLAIPVLHNSAGAYGVGSQQVPWWASAIAPAGIFALVLLAGFGPALRAGRLSAAEAIAAGRAPRAGRGYAAHRLAARLRLPRPAGLGLAAPFARPARTVVTLAAVAFGATAVIFAFGLSSSLSRAAASQTHSATIPVRVEPFGPGAGPGQMPTAAQNAAVPAALRAQPGTLHEVTLYGNGVKVPGIAGTVNAQAFGG